MDVLIPVAVENPKTRLAPVLDADERVSFARAMLADVCGAVIDAGASVTILATAPIECDQRVVVDDRPLTAAVQAHLEAPVAVVMADLPLATPAAIRRLFETDGDVIVAPGLGGGTNALVVREPGFTVDYHGASIRDHRRIAREIGASVGTVDSFKLAVDVDEPADLAEILLHSDGLASEWLREAGFVISATDGRVVATRR